jgi:hypothetical protein
MIWILKIIAIAFPLLLLIMGLWHEIRESEQRLDKLYETPKKKQVKEGDKVV